MGTNLMTVLLVTIFCNLGLNFNLGVYDDAKSLRRLYATANPEKYDLAPIEYRHPHRDSFQTKP